jgi:hypothetical protein
MRGLFTLVLALAAVNASAQMVDVTTGIPASQYPGFAVAPYEQSVWYEPARSGSGWFFGTVNTRPTPLRTAAYYTYDDAGHATWYLMQGVQEVPTWRQVRDTGVLGRVAGPLLRASGGACPECVYRPPTVTPSEYGEAELVYTSSVRAEARISGELIETLEPIDLSTVAPLPDLLVGRWQLTYRIVENNTLSEYQCEVEIVAVSASALDYWEAAPGANPKRIPPQGGDWLRVNGSACSAVWQPEIVRNYHIVYDRATTRLMGLALAQHSVSQIFVTDPFPRAIGYRIHEWMYSDVHVLGPDRVVLRTHSNRQTLPPHLDRLRSEELLVRLP